MLNGTCQRWGCIKYQVSHYKWWNVLYEKGLVGLINNFNRSEVCELLILNLHNHDGILRKCYRCRILGMDFDNYIICEHIICEKL